jgi:hypothetical protein
LKLDLDAFLPDKELIRLWPEWSSSGLWQSPHHGHASAGPMVHEDHYNISKGLKQRLANWQAHWDAQEPWAMFTDGSQPAFLAEGLEIAMALSKELGPDCAIEYEIIFVEDKADEDEDMDKDMGRIRNVFGLFHEGQCIAIYPLFGPNPLGEWRRSGT